MFLKIFFSRTSRPNSIKHCTNYPWMKGVRLCSGPLQRGDNHKNIKIGWGHLKIFSRTTGSILTDMAQIILRRNDSKFVQIKGIAPLQGR
jgi:hypothetical protein